MVKSAMDGARENFGDGSMRKRIEEAKRQLAGLRSPDSENDEEAELRALEEDIAYEQAKASADKNVRIGRYRIKGGGQLLFRQPTQNELKMLKDAKKEDVDTIFSIVLRRCTLDSAQIDKLIELWPNIENELGAAWNTHMNSAREERAGK